MEMSFSVSGEVKKVVDDDLGRHVTFEGGERAVAWEKCIDVDTTRMWQADATPKEVTSTLQTVWARNDFLDKLSSTQPNDRHIINGLLDSSNSYQAKPRHAHLIFTIWEGDCDIWTKAHFTFVQHFPNETNKDTGQDRYLCWIVVSFFLVILIETVFLLGIHSVINCCWHSVIFIIILLIANIVIIIIILVISTTTTITIILLLLVIIIILLSKWYIHNSFSRMTIN